MYLLILTIEYDSIILIFHFLYNDLLVLLDSLVNSIMSSEWSVTDLDEFHKIINVLGVEYVLNLLGDTINIWSTPMCICRNCFPATLQGHLSITLVLLIMFWKGSWLTLRCSS